MKTAAGPFPRLFFPRVVGDSSALSHSLIFPTALI